MIKLERGPVPDFWTRERVKKWTQSWLNKNCESKRWAWPQYKGQKINHPACDAMKDWHHGKCAFCETPLFGHREIEHFRSKTKHPLAAFIWRNLFLICSECNSKKGDSDHTGSLKPDRDDPANYLWVNPITLKIEPKPGIPNEAHHRALKTIKLYALDRPELSKLYKRHWQNLTSSGPIVQWLRFGFNSSQDEQDILAQLPFQRAQLQALADPSQPFSLMVRSLLS